MLLGRQFTLALLSPKVPQIGTEQQAPLFVLFGVFPQDKLHRTWAKSSLTDDSIEHSHQFAAGLSR